MCSRLGNDQCGTDAWLRAARPSRMHATGHDKTEHVRYVAACGPPEWTWHVGCWDTGWPLHVLTCSAFTVVWYLRGRLPMSCQGARLVAIWGLPGAAAGCVPVGVTMMDGGAGAAPEAREQKLLVGVR